MFGVVQAAAIELVAVSNIHTNVLPFFAGYLVKLTKHAVGPGNEISPTIDRWRVDPLEGIFIVRLRVGRAHQTQCWQITGREAVYTTADEALAASAGSRRGRNCRMIFTFVSVPS